MSDPPPTSGRPSIGHELGLSNEPDHSDPSDQTARRKRRHLNDVLAQHTPHPRSLLDEESRDSYNEEAARQDFGDDFVDNLAVQQRQFRGDWWQIALLCFDLQSDERAPNRQAKDRLTWWNRWRLGDKHDEFVHLEQVDLGTKHLDNARLSRGHFEHAQLFFAYLEDADLSYVHLEYSHMEQARCKGANVQDARLMHAYMRHAHLMHACLADADLNEANVEWVHFEHADLGGANLRGARTGGARFERTNVRETVDLLFDDNRIEGIHIEGNAPDPWSVLRRTYTGPWFFVHLLLLAIFFAPFVGRAVYYTAMGQAQEWSIQQYEKLGERFGEVERFRELHQEAWKRFQQGHVERRAIWVLLGWDRASWPMILATVVILYNILRGYLTIQVSMLRDAEERSHTTPRLIDYYGQFHPITSWRWYRFRDWGEAYKGVATKPFPMVWRVLTFVGNDWIGLYRLHVLARLLFWIAIFSVAVNAFWWLRDTWIWVPVAR